MTGTFYREITLDIPANGQTAFNAKGSRIAVLSLSGSVEMQIGSSGQRTDIRAGIGFGLPDFQDFTELRFFETAGSSAQITFAYGQGEILDSRLTISGSINSTQGSTLSTSTPVTLVNGGGATQIIPANSSRISAVLYNNGSNEVWIGDSNVSASGTRGTRLSSDQTIFLDTAAAIFGDNSGGADADISIMELET